MKLFYTLAQLLFPPKCILCGALLEKDDTDLCPACRTDGPDCGPSRVKFPFLDSWVAIWHYEGLVRRSIHRFKFRGRRHYAKRYGKLLAMKLLQQHPEGFDLLTWVPTSPLRKLYRGYDQVELLANAVGSELGVMPVPLLKKIRHNRPQSGIRGDAQRRANVLGAYRVKDPALIQSKRIVLLDDVITTGATAGECARVLLTAGAEEVHFGAVACARHKTKK